MESMECPIAHALMAWSGKQNTKAPMNLANNIVKVMSWWNTVPNAERRTAFRPRAVQRATGIAPGNLPNVLMLLGWRSSRMWSRQDGRRVLRVLYSPPGIPPLQARRGRPPVTLFDLFGGRAL
jgi:hypothetical protein